MLHPGESVSGSGQAGTLVMGAALGSSIYAYFAWRSAPDCDHGTNLTV